MNYTQKEMIHYDKFKLIYKNYNKNGLSKKCTSQFDESLGAIKLKLKKNQRQQTLLKKTLANFPIMAF